MADIKLKNAANTEFSISHNGTRGAKAVTSDQIIVAVETINDFPTNAETGDTVMVKDLNRGGTFIYDATQSAVNNGGTVFDGWVRQYSGAVNVKWFGAKGDGVTDDTIAIQNAIDNFKKIELTIDCVFATNKLTLGSNITITGLGTLKNLSFEPCLYAYQQDNITIEKISIIGSNRPLNDISIIDGDKAIYLNECSNSIIEDVVVSNTFAWGVIQNKCVNVIFSRVKSLSSNKQSAIAITNGCINAKALDCYAENSGLYGIEVEGLQDGSSPNDGVYIHNMTAKNCFSGASIVRSNNVYLTEAKLFENSGYGAYIENVINCNIKDSIIKNNKNPIFIQDAYSCSIENNDVYIDINNVSILGCIYIYSYINLIGNHIVISKNKFYLQDASIQIINAENISPLNIDIKDNIFYGVSSKIMKVRTLGTVENNTINEVYTKTLVANSNYIYSNQSKSKNKYSVSSDGSSQSSVLYFPNHKEVLFGVHIKFKYSTVNAQTWRLFINGILYTIGDTLAGTNDVIFESTVQIPVSVFAKNTQLKFEIRSSTLAYTTYTEVRPIVISTL